MKKYALMALAALMLMTSPASAHCEIPCGIFDDGTRFDILMEHATTIEKSMREIDTLSTQETPDLHGITRWTVNKEKHAEYIQDIVAQYFLAQRIKLPAPDSEQNVIDDYATSLTLLHHITIKAMKTKQTLDTSSVEALREVIGSFKEHYFKDHGHEH